jgi:serine/threonine-protein kinase RsbW
MDRPVDGPDHFPVVATMRVHGADDLVRARRLVATTAAGLGLGADRIEQFTIAVNEVATNALVHGSGNGTITVTGSETAITVEVRDHGAGLGATPGPDMPHPTDIGGRGLWLARQFCDHLEISSSTSGTTVLLAMRL